MVIAASSDEQHQLERARGDDAEQPGARSAPHARHRAGEQRVGRQRREEAAGGAELRSAASRSVSTRHAAAPKLRRAAPARRMRQARIDVEQSRRRYHRPLRGRAAPEPRARVGRELRPPHHRPQRCLHLGIRLARAPSARTEPTWRKLVRANRSAGKTPRSVAPSLVGAWRADSTAAFASALTIVTRSAWATRSARGQQPHGREGLRQFRRAAPRARPLSQSFGRDLSSFPADLAAVR
jgi:hypothetical protein